MFEILPDLDILLDITFRPTGTRKKRSQLQNWRVLVPMSGLWTDGLTDDPELTCVMYGEIFSFSLDS